MNQTEQPPPAGNSNARSTTRLLIGGEHNFTYLAGPDWCRPDKPMPTFVLPCGELLKGVTGRGWGRVCVGGGDTH